MPRRVVITGCGVLTAAGSDLDSFWRGLLSGKSLIGAVKGFSCPEMDVVLGAESTLGDGEPVPGDLDDAPYRARCARLALTAARSAVDHAGLTPRSALLAEAGIVLGSTLAEERQVGDMNERAARLGTDALDAGFLDRTNNHKLAANIATHFGLGGPVLLNTMACSSGNASVALAFDLIVDGTVDLMLAGGADTFTRLIYCGFARMSALSKSVCRPFDRARDGVSFGEGAGMLVMEELDHAKGRGARILAEVVGYGISNDAYHVTAPEPNGAGFVHAIERALTSAGVSPDEVGYVCAHGTGTQYNDQGEVRAIRSVFGDRASRIPVSSIKGTIGHTNGAAGVLATTTCALALLHQEVPPTANLADPDPEFGLDFVVGQGRKVPLQLCLNMSAGFGGSNVCLLLARAP